MYFRNRGFILQKGINFNLQHNEYVKSIHAQVKFLCFETEKYVRFYFNDKILGKLNEIHR